MAKNFPINNVENAILKGVQAYNYIENERHNYGTEAKEAYTRNFPAASYIEAASSYYDQNPEVFLMGSDSWGSKTKKVGL